MSVERLVSFSSETMCESDVIYRCQLPNGGRISVLDRMTGFGWRDIETGYRSPCGGFWLASGGHDIRKHLHELADHDAMERWVIERANTCTGYGLRTAYVRTFPECVA